MNLKKCTSLILALLLLVSNAGLAFNVHYCGGKIASVTSVFADGKACEMDKVVVEKSCCKKKIVVKHSKCCKDKVVTIKSKTDQSLNKTFSFQSTVAFVIAEWKPVVFRTIPLVKMASINDYYCDAHPPPLFKLYSQYIFYA
ncbi:HYC_CC_PP family protein [Flavobacterium sp. 3HN19-14]|uniref:HYC_CC_PP family protein n=1 Tax=Flavobacterium sp. 3HN19-14 TaxID=3448133 RepID=UPI003EE22402